ncbi:MAG TPA: anhydro-N-acetylmuramic acid kinase [Verrucomicrobiae bacterium]
MHILGLMSGTSIDAADCALCTITWSTMKLEELWSVPFPKVLQKRLHTAASNQATTYELGQLHHDLGRFYAKAATSHPAVKRAKAIGLHGQTIFHNADANAPATWQIGEPAYLARALRVPIVYNFRANDLAAGGQGAPLATMFHVRAFAEQGKHICVNNLGGISNVTSIDWRTAKAKSPKLQAFDTGPANVLLDLALREHTGGKKTFDKNGQLARKGVVNAKLLTDWLKNPYFRKAPPKSTGRELFGEPFWHKHSKALHALILEDRLATLTEFTASSLALNYTQHLPQPIDKIILCGGGAMNGFLRERIAANVKAEVSTTDSLGWPTQSIEAAAFALLAWQRLHGLPGNLPSTTGAKEASLLGCICEV